MVELTLSAVQGNWRLFMTRKADNAFLDFVEKVYRRDSYTCQFCGFCASIHMEAINVDGDYLNNKLSNLVTSCPFCAQCCFLDAVGKGDFGGGTLIYLPEMTQGQICALSHVLFSSIASGCEYSSKAKEMYRDLKLRSQLVEQQLGEGLSSPAIYGQMLIDTTKSPSGVHEELVKSLRLLPNLKKYGPLSTEWACAAVQALA